MKISELLTEDLIILEASAKDKDSIIKEMADVLNKAGKIEDEEKFLEAINEREGLGSTGVGYGIAIPHAKTKAVISPALAFAKSKEGIEYESLDGEKADIFFMIAAPEGGENLHLQTLAKLSRKLIDDDFRESIRKTETKESLMKVLSKID